MKDRETWDDRYDLIGHPYLHYGVATTNVNFAAGVDSADAVILATAAITVTLPDATAKKGKAYYIKNANVAGNVTVARTGGQTIDGAAANRTLAQNTAALFVSDGANWWIAAFYGAAFPLP
jgi:hypothetical protein